jgi:Rrf2 family transcriptional regulator, nitric oxide-sensitive transcriptional repressor
MQLTQFSDYSLRVLLYLTARPERWVPLPEISRAYGVSHNHMAKVAQLLLERGYVESLRGRTGGLRLAKPPSQINVGSVVRATEPHFDLVECFDAKTNTCPIDPVCGLKGALVSAQKAFLQELDRFTLADFLPRAPALVKLWNKNLL